MTAPLVSVIVPVFNGARTIVQALDSIRAQTYHPLEILVVDDGSTDDTAAQVKAAFGNAVCYLAQIHRGAGAARNTGIQAAAGQFFAFLDADDLWAPDKLQLQLDLIHAQPELDMVFGYYTEFAGAGPGAETAPKPGYSAGTMLVARAAFTRVGGFATQWQLGEFIEWYARALEAGLRGGAVPHVVLHRRMHANSTGTRERSARQAYAQIVSRALVRRGSLKDGPN